MNSSNDIFSYIPRGEYQAFDKRPLNPPPPLSSAVHAQMDGSNYEENEDNISIASSSLAPDGSVVSNVTDKHGFFVGPQNLPESKRLTSPKTTKDREKKWLEMTDNWNKQMKKNFKKVQKRCRKGIPQSIRPRAWLYLSGAYTLLDENKLLYYELCNQPGDRKWIEDIRKDLHRQFPSHEMFASQDGPGQKELFNVLKAYTIYRPKIGYCQAQAPIAAFLLMHMPAEQSFWCLVAMCDKYLVNYYSPGMENLILDGNILFALLKEKEPNIHKLLKKQSIDPILYMTEWFLCAFTRSLPWPTLLRFWDIFLFDGVKTLFKMGLLLTRVSLQGNSYSTLKKRYPTMCETLEALRNPPSHLLEENKIIKKLIQFEISEDTFRYHHERQMLLMKRNLAMKEGRKTRESDIF